MAYTRQTMTRELAEELIRQHGGNRVRTARAIQHDCVGKDGLVPTIHAVRMWLNDAMQGVKDDPDRPKILASDAERVNQLKNLLDEAGIPIESIGRINTAKVRSGFHEGLTKDEKGEPVVTRLRSKSATLVISPTWDEGPKWPLTQPAKPAIIKYAPYRPAPKVGRTVVVVPDTQIGFLRDIEDVARMTPIHDPTAISLAVKIVADLQPDQLGYIGDFLDLPEMSRFIQMEEFWRTTQPAIDEGYKVLCRFEAAAGPRETREPTMFIAGNHDRRLRESVLKNARAAFNLRPAASTPESWPDLSVPRLLRFDELGIEYCGEYPGGEWWITRDLVARHNPESRTAYDASVIAGHTHRIREETFTHRTQTGRTEHTLFEIGCLCSLENYSDGRSLMATRVPSGRGFVKDWAQGLTVIHIDDDGTFDVHTIRIKRKPDGTGLKALYAGKTYEEAYEQPAA